MFPGEEEAIATVKALGGLYGYGNLITHLKDAWSEMLRGKYEMPKESADLAAGHVCVWCGIDWRTGKKAKRRQP